MVVALAQLLDIQERLQVPVDELCALWDAVPSIALRGETSLFDRVFNLSPLVRQQGRSPDSRRLINATSDIRARLVAGLRISDQDLTLLKEGLQACFGRIKADAQGEQTFIVQGLWLDNRNLSLLYRHARLARLLKLSIAELLQTMALTASVASKASNERCISSLADLRAVLDVHGWRATSGFSLPEALFITKAVSALAGYDSPDVLAPRIADEVAAEKSLHISLDLFTQIGLTQSESARLIAANSEPVGGNQPLLEKVPGDESYRVGRAIAIAGVAPRFLFDPEPRAVLIAEVARDVFRIVKRGGDSGFEPAALIELGLSVAEAGTLVNANLSSRSSVPDDGKPFERVQGSTTHYRLRSLVSEAAAITGFGTNPEDIDATKIILAYRIVVRHVAEVARELYRIVKRGGAAGFEPASLVELGLSIDEARALVDANLSSAAVKRGGDTAFEPAALVEPVLSPIEAVALVDANLSSAAVKRGGDTAFEPAALVEPVLSPIEAIVLVDASLSSAAADGKPFERVPDSTTPHYRLRAAVSEGAAIAGFGTNPQDFAATKSILRHRAVELVLRHHAETVLAAKASTAVKVSPEKTRALLNLAMPSTAAERQSLVDALQGGPLQVLSTVLDRVIRYAVLFRSAAYDPQALEFVGANPAVLALSDPPTAETIRRVSRYASLAAAPDPAYEPNAPKTDANALQSVLTWTDSIANATDTQWTDLALALRTDVPYLQASKAITGATWATGTAAYTSAAHGYAVGDLVKIASVTPSGYNVAAGFVTAVRTNSFGVGVKSDPGAYSSGGTAQRFEEGVKGVLSVLSQMELAGGDAVASRMDELSQLKSAVALTRRLGVAPEILRLAVSEDFAQLARGAEGVFAAIRAKYPNEKAFREKLEPFEDKLRSCTRDGLVEYLLSAPDDGANTDWRTRFINTNDLYHHFLTDVMVEGCARTSKVVAAVSSVQLYVHRVLMNLEQSEGSPVVAARFDKPERQEEWRWRKNYQVWVANRKVFLYPENYIEPGLRDDKTPLFKELEDTLLQQQITEQNVLDAYAQYLHGFEEVARLRIAGAYHDRHYDEKQQPTSDLLHLFGVTASDPPVYYYRTIRDLENERGPVFSAWRKLDLQIPVRKVSPIVFLGRLYVFWVETTTRPLSEFKEGSSTFKGYRHSVRTKFSQLRLDGQWTPPQTLKVTDHLGGVSDLRIVDDRLTPPLVELRITGIKQFSLNLDIPWQKKHFDTVMQNAGWTSSPEPRRADWDRRNQNHVDPLESYAP
jgi:hypothetical protein